MYKCECGREFDNPQKFNGHKSHCKEHYLAKYGTDIQYNKMVESVNKRYKDASKKYAEIRLNKKEQKLQKWISEQHICEKCGKIMTEKFGSGRFCSISCANSKIISKETKEKISNSLLVTKNITEFPDFVTPEMLAEFKSKKAKEIKTKKIKEKKYCKNCGKELSRYNSSGYCKSCILIIPERKELRIQAGKKGYITSINNGYRHTWQSRNIISYPEQFWIKVLSNNNIIFKKELPVRKANGINNYFLDFYIEKNNIKLDLEIDGKQHEEIDRKESDLERDQYLKKQGYIIYRIKWNNINTDAGKQLMKEKIDKFIAFYNNL